jgi:hypothetical protein
MLIFEPDPMVDLSTHPANTSELRTNRNPSLTQNSSFFLEYSFPLVLKLTLMGFPGLGRRIKLKICFPDHMAAGFWIQGGGSLMTMFTSSPIKKKKGKLI